MSVFPQTFPVFLPEFFFWEKFADSFWCFFRTSGWLAVWTEYCSLLPIFRHYCKAHISQLRRTGTVSILKMLKITIILKFHWSEDLKCSANTGPWTSMPQESYQGHKAITACAVLLDLGLPHTLRGCEHLQHMEIHCTWLSGGEPCPRLLLLQEKTIICPQAMGLWEKNSHTERYMGNYRKTLVKMMELAWKEVLKKHEDLQLAGQFLGKWQQPPNNVWRAIFSVRWWFWFDLWLHRKKFKQIQSKV